MAELSGAKILITGPTGLVATPVTLALSRSNEVWGVARFRDPVLRRNLMDAAVRCVDINLVDGDFAHLPTDFDYVLNLAVVKSGRFDKDLVANAESLGLLMSHCRKARAFLHCSTTGVYQPDGHRAFAEGDALGDNHRSLMPTYSIAKISAEVVARYCAREFNLPTVIARLNVPYGDGGGWPGFHLEQILADDPVSVNPDAPSLYNPIHSDDIIGHIPSLLAVASVPATTLNWAGPDSVSIEEWCEFMGELVGREPRFVISESALSSVRTDNTLMNKLIGPAQVAWKDGMTRMVKALHPEALGT
ncbi:MAG: NAD-dependent epimerase/dehydratase family protein [Acidimicrobiales bacterium]